MQILLLNYQPYILAVDTRIQKPWCILCYGNGATEECIKGAGNPFT